MGVSGHAWTGLWIWTVENRSRYDAEWALVKPLIPLAKRGGNKRTVDMRAVVDGLMYILGTGCQWAAIPKDLAPRSTVHDYFSLWTWDGTLERLHHAAEALRGRD